MAVPKRRQSVSRTAKRRSHHAKQPIQLERCTQCQTAVPSHLVCPTCGNYQGRVAVEPQSDE